MHRYATAPRSTFEKLFEQARAGKVILAAAEYPPVCTERAGEVSLSLGRTGAMIMHVRASACTTSEFRLKLLFETGSCVFATPEDLGDFWTGPLAAAFGIERAHPLDDPPPAAAVAESQKPAAARGGSPTATSLTLQLARVIHGQDPALERVASAVVAQLTKRTPARPGSMLLIGPAGVGKTATVEALPAALRALGLPRANVFRIDCGELTESIQLTRLLGSPPGYSGHEQDTPFLAALAQRGCILLVDEIGKAHPDVFDLLLGLLDVGRLTGTSGQAIDATRALVALTTSAGSNRLVERLGATPLEDRWAVRRACRDHLSTVGLPHDLIDRIGTFAMYAALAGDDVRRSVTHATVVALGREYGLVVDSVDPIVIDVIEDIARDSGSTGARGSSHAAQELLCGPFAALASDGPLVRVSIGAGPPLRVDEVSERLPDNDW